LLLQKEGGGLLQVPVNSLEDLFAVDLLGDADPVELVDLQVLDGDRRIPVHGLQGRPTLAGGHAGYLFAHLKPKRNC
jgi:hypothetical protein